MDVTGNSTGRTEVGLGASLSALAAPVICAPMFLVSGPALVIAAGASGIIGSMPALNGRTAEDFEVLLEEIEQARAAAAICVPYAIQVSLRTQGSERFERDFARIVERRVPIVITSLGDPSRVAEKVHAYGGACFHDVTEMRFVEKAIAAGVDGLIAVCSGAGGHAGPLSPMALIPRLRDRYDGIIVLAGAVSDGRAIRAAQCLGADLVSMGTRFIATRESNASDAYKQMLVAADMSDIVLTRNLTSVHANFIAQSIVAAGMDPLALPPPKGPWMPDLPEGVKPWRDIWSAGHGVGLINNVPTVAELVDRLRAEMAG